MDDIFEELAAAASDEEEQIASNNQEVREDEAQEVNEETERVVKPKRTISRPIPKLDPARLLGPRGIFVLKSTFDGVKFKGKGHELDDLNNVLSRLQHWAHRLFPKMTFEDCINKIEDLGAKREIQTNMHKIRTGMVDLDSPLDCVEGDVENVRVASPPPQAVDDAFDQLITVAPPANQSTLTEEQRARMMRNRLIAEERRMARRQAREKELEEQRRNFSDETPVALGEKYSSSIQRGTMETNSDVQVPLSSSVDGSAVLPVDDQYSIASSEAIQSVDVLLSDKADKANYIHDQNYSSPTLMDVDGNFSKVPNINNSNSNTEEQETNSLVLPPVVFTSPKTVLPAGHSLCSARDEVNGISFPNSSTSIDVEGCSSRALNINLNCKNEEMKSHCSVMLTDDVASQKTVLPLDVPLPDTTDVYRPIPLISATLTDASSSKTPNINLNGDTE